MYRCKITKIAIASTTIGKTPNTAFRDLTSSEPLQDFSFVEVKIDVARR